MAKTLPANAGGAGLIPGQGAKIPHDSRPKKRTQNIKQKQYCRKFNKDFKKWSTSKKKIFKNRYRQNTFTKIGNKVLKNVKVDYFSIFKIFYSK